MINKFWGKVRKHQLRGHKLGFPTANINLSKKIPEGIYFSQTKIKNQKFCSLTFIGKAETFNEKKYHSETYILNFNKNIYGSWVTILLLKKIRKNKKFSSATKLIDQMKKDEQQAKKYFKI